MELIDRYGPWAIVAGASEGTGRAFALQLAAAGIHCVLIARRQQPLLELAGEIQRAYAVECLTVSLDLSLPDACERIVAAVGEREVGLYISNAGADPNGAHFLDLEVSAWEALVNRNLLTTLRCCHHFATLMRERGRGGILLVGSGACYGGGSNLATYSACKAFDLCFAESLWAELRPCGVDVLYLALTMTDTPALRELLAGQGLPVPGRLSAPEAVARAGLERLPCGPVHNFGQDDAIAGYAPTSPAQRRERVLFIDEMSKAIFAERE
ncbi:MAG: SDR family NAD(P)-dependent oxidoreductase [Haliea sp.]|nr:SDR family NAD(P)-dependent oxidoreductase [Haliea sp.]